MRVRIRPGLRGLDAYVVSDELTLTKNWTTVTESEGQTLLALQYRGQPFVEADEAEVDEAPVEEEFEELAEEATDAVEEEAAELGG